VGVLFLRRQDGASVVLKSNPMREERFEVRKSIDSYNMGRFIVSGSYVKEFVTIMPLGRFDAWKT
jgi:hypothetical protein